ncbi:hypothetical protein ACFVT9_38005, partial [Kitasatospora cineracea]|uniref:hypothetical protein n=1 Tax=Kitasatospora cineracea TaxID=88074 RepID=UPI0036DE7B72
MEVRTISHSQEYDYLWNGREPGWVLYLSAASDIPVIFNRITRMALVVEDVKEWRALANSM